MPPSSTLTVGPAHGDLLLRTRAEGPAARMGHDLTFRVRDWECVTQLEDGTPVSVALTLHLASLEVLRGDGGMKPLTEGDKKKVLAGASKTLGNGPSRFTASKVTGKYMLHGLLDL